MGLKYRALQLKSFENNKEINTILLNIGHYCGSLFGDQGQEKHACQSILFKFDLGPDLGLLCWIFFYPRMKSLIPIYNTWKHLVLVQVWWISIWQINDGSPEVLNYNYFCKRILFTLLLLPWMQMVEFCCSSNEVGEVRLEMLASPIESFLLPSVLDAFWDILVESLLLL